MNKPRLIVGAPVAERAWILDRWHECLRQQTMPPDEYCFIYSESQDDTLASLKRIGDGRTPCLIRKTRLPYFSRNDRNLDPQDPHRAKHMAALRNQLKTMFMQTDGDVFVSLDTDILLERSDILEQLIYTIRDGWDVACALTCLHPLGEQSQCYNAGVWWGGTPGSFDQAWKRCDEYEVRMKPPVRIDIPMACFAIRRHAMGMCAYRAHDQGEDIGFAQSLAHYGYRVGWRTDLQAQHYWSADYLGASV